MGIAYLPTNVSREIVGHPQGDISFQNTFYIYAVHEVPSVIRAVMTDSNDDLSLVSVLSLTRNDYSTLVAIAL